MRKSPLFTYTAVSFAFLLLAAHFFRWSQMGLSVVFLLAPFLLIFKSGRLLGIVQLLLCAGSVIWLHACGMIVSSRIATGDAWWRTALILIVAALFTGLNALILQQKQLQQRYSTSSGTSAGVIAFVMVAFIGAFPHVKLSDPVPLLAERFIHGAGWVELFALALYASWLAEKLTIAKNTASIRRNVWILFSGVFFTQVLLGLAGIHKLLMTGTLHIPVPAMIIAAPLYRGEFSLFMPLLLVVTIVLAGPAWCSWFCYFGSFDLLASQKRTGKAVPPRPTIVLRLLILAGICCIAVLFNQLDTPLTIASICGLAFGGIGVALMLFVSRKRGLMMHCTSYCPIGLLTTIAGKINPFRIRIGSKCTRCHACIQSCKYGALSPESIIRHAPSLTCTLCGDCIAACHSSQLQYQFPLLTNAQARSLFLVIVVVIHALFMGFGRL